MPRLFFHVQDDFDCPYPEGSELPNVGAARLQAEHGARRWMCDLLTSGNRIAPHHGVVIEEDARAVVATVAFRDVANIED